MDVQIFVTQGLGDNSYLLHSNKEAIIVDPQRDIWRFQNYISDNDLNLKYVLETHVHNDYISGALEIRDEYNADLLLPQKGDYEFEHRGVTEGYQSRIGEISVEVLETPGHTYEHISWLVNDQENNLFGIFTGGSMIVGSAGRTDLLGHKHTNELTKLQYQSIQKLKSLPNSINIYPTHGAGSFCTSSNPSDNRVSTLKREKEYNQAVTAKNIEEFMEKQLTGLKEYPTYYKYMASINRRGPKVYGKLPSPKPLSVKEVEELDNQGAYIIDTRDRFEFANNHLKNALNFEIDPSLANYVGWLVPIEADLVLIIDDPVEKNLSDTVTQLFRIGYENVIGYLSGGIDAWQEAGKETVSYKTSTYQELCNEIKMNNDVEIIDVRQPVEYEELHLPNSQNYFVGGINEFVKHLDVSKEVYVICASGHRATIASSILQKHGKKAYIVTNGGVNDVNNCLN